MYVLQSYENDVSVKSQYLFDEIEKQLGVKMI